MRPEFRHHFHVLGPAHRHQALGSARKRLVRDSSWFPLPAAFRRLPLARRSENIRAAHLPLAITCQVREGSTEYSLSVYSARHVPHRTKVRRNAFLLYRNASGRSSGTRIASNSVQSKREPVDLIGVGTIERSTLAFAGRAVTLEIAPMGSSSHALPSSEERRAGKECVSTCR